MSERKLDLNLLRTLEALLEEESVSRAADRLGVSQPAVSSALSRLREQLDDELFVRRSTGMLPTPFAESLRRPVRRAMAMIDSEILRSRNFDPASTSRAFRIASSDLGEATIMPGLIQAIAREAPHSRLISGSHPPRMLSEAIMRDEVDVAIGYFPDLTANGMHEENLTVVPLVCVVREDHPLAGRQIDRATFETLPQVIVGHDSRIIDPYEAQIQSDGVKRQIIAHLANMTSLPPVIAATDCLAIVPQTILEKYPGLATLEVPFELPTLDIKMYWHHRCHNDASNVWIRGVIQRNFRA